MFATPILSSKIKDDMTKKADFSERLRFSDRTFLLKMLLNNKILIYYLI